MKNLQADITTRILGTMQTGNLPWRRPWRAIAAEGFPCNAVSNRPYSGGNVMLLWLRQQAEGWPTMRFLTFKQAKEAGGSVRKGEHGIGIVYMATMVRKDDKDEDKRFGFLKSFTVFNVAQCDGLPERFLAHIPARILEEGERNTLADAFLTSTGASITHDGGSRAYYRPATDSIHLPVFASFVSSDAFYSTAFHEVAHWTGHESRLTRGKFASRDSAYAFEELVAEIASSFMCGEFQMENIDNTAAYIQSWITLLKADERAFIRAASAASKAVDYLRGLAVAEDEEAA